MSRARLEDELEYLSSVRGSAKLRGCAIRPEIMGRALVYPKGRENCSYYSP